jgi:hypothetical protein
MLTAPSPARVPHERRRTRVGFAQDGGLSKPSNGVVVTALSSAQGLLPPGTAARAFPQRQRIRSQRRPRRGSRVNAAD